MASRRMFSHRLISSARFIKMPISSQALYFHLGMNADDDGVVEAFNVINTTGCTEDDLKVLVAKGFVTVLNEDLVSYIVDWRENNYIRADRKIDSIYRDLLVSMNPDVEYLESKERSDKKKKVHQETSEDDLDGQWTVNGRSMDGIGKDRLVEDRLDQDSLDEYCGESDEPPTPPEEIFIKIPLIDKTDFDVPESLVAEYQETYPALDIRQKLRSMRQWCLDNPTKRKTRRGIRKFIGGWLEREQNSGRFDNQQKQPKPQQQTSAFNRMEKSGTDYDSLFGVGKIGQG